MKFIHAINMRLIYFALSVYATACDMCVCVGLCVQDDL